MLVSNFHTFEGLQGVYIQVFIFRNDQSYDNWTLMCHATKSIACNQTSMNMLALVAWKTLFDGNASVGGRYRTVAVIVCVVTVCNCEGCTIP